MQESNPLQVHSTCVTTFISFLSLQLLFDFELFLQLSVDTVGSVLHLDQKQPKATITLPHYPRGNRIIIIIKEIVMGEHKLPVNHLGMTAI